MYIIGAGGHGSVIAEIIELNGFTVTSFIDEDTSLIQNLNIDVIHVFPTKLITAVVAIGNNLLRKKITNTYRFNYLTLIHPKTCISKRANIGLGTVVIGGATININGSIGKHVIVNTNASVGHDCSIGDYVHIGPNAALAGNVTVGEGTHIGIGATVIQGIKIGRWCIIGAGAVVINDVLDGEMVVGNPARVIKEQVIDFGQESVVEI
jgi:sugar O-acyltransferase (sialic acid O-acetyltransferase NeuD family)